MASRDSGTVRPTKRKRVFLAAAVLLLVCVLAAGAVSAEKTICVNTESDFKKALEWSLSEDTTIVMMVDITLDHFAYPLQDHNLTLTTGKDTNHTISWISGNSVYPEFGMFYVKSGKHLTITGNGTGTLTLKGKSDGQQNLIMIEDTGYFTLDTGGILANNTADHGGAVNMTGGIFTMSGGTIANNTASEHGGAVYMTGGTFTMSGGTIANNTASEHGGAVYMTGGTFTMKGGTIANNTAKSGFGGGLYVDGNNNNAVDIRLSDNAEISNNTATNGGGVFMKGSGTKITLSGTAKISNNKAVEGSVGTLGTGHGGGVHVDDGTFSISDSVIITNNEAEKDGGGVYVHFGGTFEMSGGTISGNTAKGTGSGSNTGNGGGVYVDDQGSTFTMSGGTISENRADGNGDGVYVGGTFNVDTTGTADSVYLPQGRVITVIQQQFTGKISGIVSENRNIGTRIVSFNSPVQGSSEDREYFQLDETLTELSLGLTYDASKNVLELAPTHTVTFNADGGTPVPGDQTVAHGDTVDDPGTLTRDGHTFAGWHKDTDCTQSWNFDTDTVTYDRTLYAKWTPKEPGPEPPSGGSSGDGNMDNAYRVLFNDGATTLYVVTDLSAGDKLTKPEDPVKDGYTFAGWHKDSACTQAWDFNDGITGSMTLYAKWTPQETVTPTATATVTPTVTATTTQTAEPTGNASPAPTSQPDNNGNNGDTTNGETTTTPGISLPYLIGGILILLLAILLLLFLLLRHTVTFLIPTGGELEEYRIKVWHGRYINTEDLPDLIRTAAWYRDPARQERWDFDQDRVTKSIELYLG